MNPPTLGHQQLIETVAQHANGGDYFVFVSKTQDSKKNPLDYETKLKFLECLCPTHAKNIVFDKSINTVLVAASKLYEQGYNSITFVAGEDQLDKFKSLLEDYNGITGKPHGYYQFNSINCLSSGHRDPDSTGISSISASAAREAVVNNNFKAFESAVGSRNYTLPLYESVRKGMGIYEES